MNLKHGHVLSNETNKALKALRQDSEVDLVNGWGIYLQADEVIHQDDYELLQRDIERADWEGYDAISFRYLHFWKTHHHLSIGKSWYPHEIRAIKLNTNIESWGDAQGFKNFKKIFYTETRIFHYGHVREKEIYDKKMQDMSTLYDQDAKKAKYYNLKDRQKEHPCVLFYGTHPMVMKERILRMKDIWVLDEKEEITIVGNPQNYSLSLLEKIAAKKIIWCDFSSDPAAVMTTPGFFAQWFNKTYIPPKMKAKSAHPWTMDFRLILQLSAKGIGLRE